MNYRRHLRWLVLPIVLCCTNVFSQQPNAEAIKKFQAKLLPLCTNLTQQDLPSLKLTSRQISNVCACATSRTTKKIVEEKVQDGDRVSEQLLLDFFECGSVEIPKAIGQDYQQRGLKLRTEVFDVSKNAGQCLGDFEYKIMMDAIIRKTQPSRMDTEEQMAKCILLK